MVKSAIESEAAKWDAVPFSFAPSQELGDLLKRRIGAYQSGKKPFPERRPKMCQACGAVIVIGGWRLHCGGKHPEVYCDKECAEADRSRIYRMREVAHKTVASKGFKRKYLQTSISILSCEGCGKKKAFKGNRFKHWQCSDQCRPVATFASKVAASKNRDPIKCKCCGCEFTKLALHGTGYLFCSNKCARRSVKRHVIYKKRTRSAITFSENISRTKLFADAGWKCKKCKCNVVISQGLNLSNEATVDHIVPLSKGGLHVWANVQCLCRKCNTEKNARLDKPMQIRMF